MAEVKDYIRAFSKLYAPSHSHGRCGVPVLGPAHRPFVRQAMIRDDERKDTLLTNMMTISGGLRLLSDAEPGNRVLMPFSSPHSPKADTFRENSYVSASPLSSEN
jgi:hypothetical protein